MEILKETKLENGDYGWEIEVTPQEYDIFKLYMVNKGHDVKKMTSNEILQGAITGILNEQIEKEEKNE